MEQPEDTASEHKLWAAVLCTYIVDADKALDRDWPGIMGHLQSRWTEAICGMIDLDFDFFVENIIKRRKLRKPKKRRKRTCK